MCAFVPLLDRVRIHHILARGLPVYRQLPGTRGWEGNGDRHTAVCSRGRATDLQRLAVRSGDGGGNGLAGGEAVNRGRNLLARGDYTTGDDRRGRRRGRG